MKLKNLTDDQSMELSDALQEGFWLALTEGYIDLEDILEEEDANRVDEAISIIQELEYACREL